MGVPKFYRWISERYPCLSEVVKEYQIPEFDNLYLDMNGIVHICSHPEDDNPHFRITEEKIFSDIFHYIEVLFRMIKPKCVFYMAVDGVAPRAKMNQQRGRRFRSAREAEVLEKKAREKGEVLPTEERFDSNCITPGTKFMVKLQEQLKYFVVNKVSTDKLWQGPRIYLSGHETPGEGEHKIMDFIRHERARPDYDANTRHCLYGLDADLIMLGMVSHDPHFSLLREEVRFGGKNSQKRSNAPEQTTFHLLHLRLLREYLDFEFGMLRDLLTFPYDLECIIDDWVLMGFLVGNDFIPHLPHVHIHGDALPLLWKTYKDVLPTLDGYLNQSGKLNLQRFETYMKKLSEHDTDQFRVAYADLRWLEGKMGESGTARQPRTLRGQHNQRGKKKGRPFNKLLTANQYMTLVKYQEGTDGSTIGLDLATLEKDLGVAPLEEAEIEVEEVEEEVDADTCSSDDDEGGESMFRHEFRHHKDGYYQEKLKYEQVTPAVLRDQAEGYVRAIQWILYYYYDGVPSWSWYYPHHYAPFISDVKNFSDMNILFDLGTPFLPFEQLMAVLPAASRKNLPDSFHKLMTSHSSPILDYYPTDFESDLNGKMQEWEAVVLIPFIEEKRLLKAMEPVYHELKPVEAARNVHGPHFLYQYTLVPVGTYPSSLPGKFPDIINHNAKVTEVPKDGFVMQRCKLRKGLCEGVKLDTFFPGFPTMKHIPHKAHLEKCGVVVFQQASRYENMIVVIEETEPTDVEQVAAEYLGRPIMVNWPHLEEARVVAVSDGQIRFNMLENLGSKQKTRNSGPPKIEVQREVLDREASSIWNKECNSITERYKTRKGVDVACTSILLYACPMIGRKYVCGYHGNITLEKQWSTIAVPYSLQATVKDIAVNAPTFRQYQSLDELFPPKAEVFMLGSPQYGCMGQVMDIAEKNDGRVRVDFTILDKPALDDVMRRERRIAVQYFPGYVVAQRVGINGHLLSRITGTIYVTGGNKDFQSGKTNVGLNLKFSKKNQEVVGYTKRENGQWLYSEKTITILHEYIQMFPELFDFITSNPNNEDGYFEQDIFGYPEDVEEDRLSALTKFLKELPCTRVGQTSCGALVLDEHVVAALEEEINRNNEVNRKRKRHIRMQVRPHLLYRPLPAQENLIADLSVEYELYDRVINTRNGYSVPLGLCGTIIGIHPAEVLLDTVYDVLFDEPFVGGLMLRCSPNRGYQMQPSALINLSHGERKEQAKAKPMAVVKPQATGHGMEVNYAQAAVCGEKYHQNSPRDGGRVRAGNQAAIGADGRHPSAYQLLQTIGRPQGQNQGQVSGRRPAPSGGQKDDDKHANFWQQLPGPPLPPGSATSTKDIAHRGTKQNDVQHTSKKNTEQVQHATNQNNMPCSGRESDGNTQRNLPNNARWKTPQGASHPGMATAPSLIEAALALDKLPVNPAPHKNTQPKVILKEHDAIHGQSDEFLSIMNSLDISSKPASTPQKSAPSQPSDSSVIISSGHPQQEVLTVTDLEVDKIQIEDKQTKEGTAALYQMLKIGQPSKDTFQSSPTMIATGTPDQTNTKLYGKQVSVMELFKGAKQQNSESGAPPAVPQVDQPPIGQRQPVPVMAASPGQQQQGAALHQTNKRFRVAELKQWSAAMGMPPPRYDYNYGLDKRASAVVTLANGLRYQGSLARNLDQAAESAASHALLSMHQTGLTPLNLLMASHFLQGAPPGLPLHQKGPAGSGQPPLLMAPPRIPSMQAATPASMSAPHPQNQQHAHHSQQQLQQQQKQQQQQQQQPRGTFCSSPNSAFTPVVPTGKAAGGPPQYTPQGQNQRFTNLTARNNNGPPPQQHHQIGMQGRHPGPFQQAQRGMSTLQGHHHGQVHQHQGHHQGQLHQGHHQGQGQPHQGHHQGQGPQHPGWTPSLRHPSRMLHHANQHTRVGPPPPPNPHPHQFNQQGKGHGSWDRWPQQLPNQGQGHLGQGKGHMGQDESHHEKKDSERRPETELPKTPSKNPFVPLQVMRQQKTPQRETKPEKEAVADTTPKKEPVSKPYSAAQLESPGSQHVDSSKPTTEGATANLSPRDKTKNSSKKTPKKASQSPGKEGKQQRKTRSRLAANFGTPK